MHSNGSTKAPGKRIAPLRSSLKPTITEDHAELDILDSLNLADDIPTIRLRHILLDNSDTGTESVKQLTNLLNGRMDEGHGEALFDVGLEDSGESMGFSKDEWNFAYERLLATAKSLMRSVGY